MDYYWLYYTFSMLSDIHTGKYDTLLQPQNLTDEIFFNYTQNNINNLRGKLPEEVLSYFVASKISVFMTEKKLMKKLPDQFRPYTAKIDLFLENNRELISDTIVYNYLVKEKESMYNEIAARQLLYNGEDAPDFYLADLNQKFWKLSDFKNKIVLLNFWGTFCGPCIKDIPKKNQLVEEFDPDKFVLVNICLDDNPGLSKEIIKEKSFKRVHLFCTGNWESLLRGNYSINGVPHYTLINGDGRIIENKIQGDLEEIIKGTI